MLRTSCLCSLLLIFHVITAQDVTKKFYDDDDRTVDEVNSLYYKFGRKSHADGDTIKSFYTQTQSLRSLEVVNEHGVRNGMMVMYHANGKVKTKGKFESGSPSGDMTSWYPDGKLQSIEFFVPVRDDGKVSNSGLVEYYDSLGNQLVTKGNGFCRCFFKVFSNPKVLEKGKISEGLRDSVWVGYRLDGTQYYEEEYLSGELQHGISFDNPVINILTIR